MNRAYVKYKKKRQRQTSRSGVWFLIVVFSLSLVGFGFYLHQPKQGTLLTNLKETAFLKASAYFPHLFKTAKAPTSSKKILAQVPETAKPIHFDFYDELPKAQLVFSQKETEEEEVSSVEKSETQELALRTEEKPASAKTKTNSFSPVILRVGLFHNLEAANRYRAALVSAGLKVDLVKAREGRALVYRLQQGPYHQLEHLKAAKKLLTERGVSYEVFED